MLILKCFRLISEKSRVPYEEPRLKYEISLTLKHIGFNKIVSCHIIKL